MPGYIIHLAEAGMIERLLEEKYGICLSDEWKNQFRLGCLIPDTKRKREKVGSHFWSEDTLENLAIAPNLVLFEHVYGSRIKGPAMIGYWVHLHLDRCYVEKFWREHFRFTNDQGQEKILREDIQWVENGMRGNRLRVEDFFSDRGYYGDYSRMNDWFTNYYHLTIPEYKPDDWEDFPVKEVNPSELQDVLRELRLLIDYRAVSAGNELVVFDREILRKYVEDTAREALERLDVDIYGTVCYNIR